jgi:hypothetical protein
VLGGFFLWGSRDLTFTGQNTGCTELIHSFIPSLPRFCDYHGLLRPYTHVRRFLSFFE